MSYSIITSASVAACVNTNKNYSNLTYIFYQAVNGDLCMLWATGTPLEGTRYNNGVVLPSAQVRANTPIAAVWFAVMSQVSSSILASTKFCPR